MKYTIELNENKYVSGIIHYGDERDYYDDDYIFNTFYKDGHRVNCYHLLNNEYLLDEIKEQEEIQKEREEAKKPTTQEKIEAQVLYTALMTDTMLEEEYE